MGLFDFIKSGPFVDRPTSSPTNIFSDLKITGNGGRGSNPFDPFQSERNEKREETKRLIREAKELVSSGKQEISDAETSMNQARSRAETAISDYSSLCQTVAHSLGEEVRPTIQRFNDFNVDARVSAPSISSVSIPSISVPTSSFIGSPVQMPSILGMFIDEYQYDKAEEQYQAARAYREEARAASEKMRIMRDRMNQIRSELNTNGRQIKELTDKTISLSSQLKSAMSQSTFTAEQADYLKSISKIADMICLHLSTTFLNSDCTINRTFRKQMEAMKELNENIPLSPRIDDQRLLNFIRELPKVPIEM